MKKALLSLLCLCAVATAQTPLGTVTGLAVDASGGAIAGAAVTLTSAQTGVKRTTATNGTGAYTVPNLPPGTYKVAAEAKGFRTLSVESLPVAAFATVRQDLRFEVAGSATEVTVTESASTVIQTESPAIGSGLATRQIIELPTNLRSVSKNSGDSGLISSIMPATIPGVVQVGSGAKWLTPGAGATGIKVKVDGIETSFGNFGSPDNVSQPSVENIQEFTASVLTTRAEFGGMGTVTSVTKSGTNEYHGDIFWYMRNSALDARNAFQTTRAFTNVHNYGAAGGGALKKDKTFVFLTFDGARGVAPYIFNASVPTAAMRSGDFSDFAALRNPFSASLPFNGNKILPQFLSPQALKMQQQFYPLPNFGPATLTSNNYRAAFNGPEVHRDFEVRLDQNWTPKHLTFARYQVRKDDYQIPGARSTLPPQSTGTSTNLRRVNFWNVGDIYTVTPNLFNEARAGLVILVSQANADLKGQALLDQFGITGLPSRGLIKGIPNVSITGINTVTQSLLNPANDGHAQFADNVTWIKGRHTAKFGGEYIRWFVNRYLTTNGNLFGNYGFTNKFSGQPYADFLLGLPTTVARLDPFPTQYARFNDLAFFAQDDFKVSNKLTLMYGLRYEYNGPTYANGDNFYSFDLASGSIVVPNQQALNLFSPYWPKTLPVITADKVGLGRSLRNADGNNFAPRAGFAYQLDSKTVLRGGWGVYYSHLSTNAISSLSTGPYAVATTATNNLVNGNPQFNLAAPFASPGNPSSIDLNAISPRLLNSYAHQYSATLEREVTRDVGVRVSYIGSKGAQLPYKRNVNQPVASTTPFAASRRPYPLFNNIIYADNGATMLYNALQVQAQKRFSHGLLFSSAWTWAKQLSDTDDTSDFELNTTVENTYNRRNDWGNSYSVPRHQWFNQLLWALPGKGLVLGGWQLSSLFNVASGNWFTPTFSGSDPSNTNTVGGRADVSAAPLSYPKTIDAWFDKTAFTVPAANSGRFGNAGRGIIQGPGYVLWNAGLLKSVKLEKFGTLQFSASFNNVLNHVNLGEPLAGSMQGVTQGTVNVNSGNAAKISATHIFPAAGSPRQGMVGLRLRF